MGVPGWNCIGSYSRVCIGPTRYTLQKAQKEHGFTEGINPLTSLPAMEWAEGIIFS